jgi:hypothetical protein
MNIFVLSRDPLTSAKSQCDKHVVKMTLETAQMLCSVLIEHGYEAPYRKAHARHPCTVWAGYSLSNWNWLVKHGTGLAAEFKLRYKKEHKSQKVIEWASELHPDIPEYGLTQFAMAMPDKYKGESVVASYRRYYINEKRRFAKWKFTQPPNWWKDEI